MVPINPSSIPIKSADKNNRSSIEKLSLSPNRYLKAFFNMLAVKKMRLFSQSTYFYWLSSLIKKNIIEK